MATTATPGTSEPTEPTDIDALSARFLSELEDEEKDELSAPAEPTEPAGDEVPEPAVPADPTPEPPAEPAPEAEAPPAEDAPPAEPPAAPAAAAPAASATPEPPAPYTIRSGGQVHELAGISREADGSLHVAPEGKRRVEELLNRGLYHETTYRRQLDEYERRLQAHDAEAEQGKALAAFWANLMDQGPDAVATFLDDFQANKRELELSLREQQIERRGQQVAEDPREQEAATAETQRAVHDSLPKDVQSVAEEFFPGVFEAEDYPRLVEALTGQTERIYFVAERDYAASDLPPAMAAAYPGGIRAGEVLMNQSELRRLVETHAAPLQRERSRAAQAAAKTKAALEANAKRNGAPGVGQPPAPSVSVGRSSAAPQAPPSIDSADSWRESMMAELD